MNINSNPDQPGTGTEFHCPYAPKGQRRCPEWRCDCFIDTHPDDPFGLHPEDFTVHWPDP